MNFIKTSIHNKMKDEFLMDSLMLFIERDIVMTFSMNV